MQFITSGIFLILFALIKIGDFIIWVVSKIKKTILYCAVVFASLPRTVFQKIFTKSKRKSGTFILPKPKKVKKTKANPLFVISKRFVRKIKKIVWLVVHKIVFVLSAIINFIQKIISSVFRLAQLVVIFPLNLVKKAAVARTRPLQKKVIIKNVEAKYAKRPFSVPVLYKAKLIAIGAIFAFVFVFLPLLATAFLAELPNPSNLSVNYIPKTTKIYDRKGNLLYEIFANQNRTIVKLSDIPKYVRDATIAIEDKDFYTHPGFDIRGIARAFLANVTRKEFQGGSTITQQLIKSAFFNPEPSLSRKIKEVILAFWTEQIYTKDRILELYLNYVPYGGTAWGIESASEIYFGKNASDLNLAQSAFLAGLPQAPTVYSPYGDSNTLWKRRQKEVLDAMVRNGYISRKDADNAYKEELVFRKPEIPLRAPHFVMYIRDLLIQRYGINAVERGGLQVKTSLDLQIQNSAQQVVSEEVAGSAGLLISNGAALVTNPTNGDILAMVGSKNYFEADFSGNVNITTSLRQPGSTIKLITYSLALSSGFTEATMLDDSPLTIYSAGEAPYTPVNYDGAFHGRVPLRTALANSYNIPAVRVAQKLGVANIVNFGREMGISSWQNSNNYGISITLGGGEVTMLDLAAAYGTVANKGRRVDLNPLLEVSDSEGTILYKRRVVPQQVLDSGVAYIVSDILADNKARSLAFGLNSPLAIPNARVSVKTGTTDNKRDNWTVGYTQNILVATWVGNNDNSPMSPNLTSGISGAAPIWNKIITNLLPAASSTTSAIPVNVIQKSCLGQDRLFVKGTENSVTCTFPKISPTPTP
jgi:penicillin-binding protein 1C